MVRDDTDALRDWVDRALVGYPDPLVPLTPDARVDIRPVGPTEIQLLTVNGIRTGAETHASYFELGLTFREREKTETIRGVAWHLRRIAQADPTLGGRVEDGCVLLDETDPEDHACVEPRLTADGWLVRIPVMLKKTSTRPKTAGVLTA